MRPQIFICTFLFLVTLSFYAFAVTTDTGIIEWKQSNGVTFMGRAWGDEFRFYMETDDGYRFIKNYADGYYYYAVLDENGEFAPSEYKVGIDQPLAESYQLDRSASREAEIDAQIDDFEQELEINRQEYQQKRADALAAEEAINYHVGIILVEFTDTLHYQSSDSTRPEGYYIRDFENMLFGAPGEWYAPNENFNSPHPEENFVFGSLRDYYYQQSIPNGVPGSLTITGHVVNPPINPLDPDSPPVWIQLDYGKQYYHTHYTIKNEAVQKAKNLGYIPQDPYKPNGPYDHLIIIYAGEIYFYGGLHPSCGSKMHHMGERLLPQYSPDRIFSHIGIHAHEFGHRLGLGHPLAARFCLMGTGTWSGPDKNTACPGGINPIYRMNQLGWVTSTDTIEANQTNFVVDYNYLSPLYYILKPLFTITNEYFVIETRGRRGFDLYTPYYNNLDHQDGALLIWRNNASLIPADNNLGIGWVDDFFPTIGLSSQNWNDETIPSSHMQNGNFSNIALQNIVWNYEINPQDTATTIGEVLLDYGVNVINTNTTWSGTVFLDRDVLIKNNAILTIQPGTVILIDTISTIERVTIRVNDGCRLNAFGTNSNPIEFKSVLSNPTLSDWEGILFANGSQGGLNHCIFKNASTAITGFWMETGNLEISNCKFDATTLFFRNSGNISIQYSTFINNSLLQAYSSYLTVDHNEFLEGSHIHLFGDHSLIKNNIMIGQTNAMRGIWIYYSPVSTTEIINNTFAFYNYGIQISYNQNHSPAIRNNIFYLNNSSSTLSGAITYNNFWNKDSATFQLPDTTNLKADPRFVNPVTGDFHLKSISPCIDGGDPNDDYYLEPYPNGNRINIGAYGNTPEATLSFDFIVQNDLNSNTTWSGYVNILNDISTNGYTLTVQPGTQILFDNEKTLSVNSILISDGQPSPPEGPDPIIFRGYRTNDIMGGVYIHAEAAIEVILHYTHFKQGDIGLYIDEIPYDEENIFDHLLFEDNTTGLYISKSSVEITSSNFHNCESGLISQSSSLNLLDSYLTDNDIQGLYLFDSDFKINSNMFLNNGLRGVYFQYCSDGLFWDNTVSLNGSSIIDTYIRGGLVFYQSSPFLSENYVTENYASGILSMSSSFPVLIEEGLNLISENRKSEEENDPEILVKDISFPVIDYGHNDIMDNLGGYLIYGDEDLREILVYVRRNYWGTVDEEEIESRLYRMGGFIFQPFDEEPNTGGYIAGGGGDELFLSAVSVEQDSNYTLALSKYDSVISLYPGTNFAKASMIRIFNLQRKTGTSLSDIQSYFNNLINHSDEGISHIARRLAFRCLTLNEQYQSAIDQHVNWQQTAVYLCDSIYSAMDIEMNNLYLQGGRLNKSSSNYIQQQNEKRLNFKSFQDKSENILNSLFKLNSLKNLNNIPLKFTLSQNYPNPFNPSTTIKYQIPENSRVKIEVFNILGQHIKTLVDEIKEASSYEIVWNGKNKYGNLVSSGVYIYRFTAQAGKEKFVFHKKMMLLK